MSYQISSSKCGGMVNVTLNVFRWFDIQNIIVIFCSLTASTDDHPDAVLQTPEMTEMEQPSTTGSTIRSSERKKADDTPTKTNLRKRLNFQTERNTTMKRKYKKRVSQLRFAIDFQKIHQIKYLNQAILRKKDTIAKKNAKIQSLKAQLANTVVAQQMNEMKKAAKNSRRNHRRAVKTKSQVVEKAMDQSSAVITDLKKQLSEKDATILELENENQCLKESLESLQSEPSTSDFQKVGKNSVMKQECLSMMPSPIMSPLRTFQS